MASNPNQGKCIGCGLFAQRLVNYAFSIAYGEVTEQERQTGQLGRGGTTLPVCMAGVPLQLEYLPLPSETTPPVKVVNGILNQDRQCPEWFEWRPRLTPEKHLELREMHRLEESNRRFLSDLEQERREWQKESGKWPSRLIGAAAILALAQVIGVVLTLPAVTRWLGLD